MLAAVNNRLITTIQQALLQVKRDLLNIRPQV